MPGGKASKRNVALEERRAMAIGLRRSGASFEQIAKQIGEKIGNPKYSRQAAHEDVHIVLKRCAEETRAMGTEHLQLELDRLDMAQIAIASKVRAGDMQAIDRWIRISERRAKLLGLDAPIELKVQEQVATQLEAQFDLLFGAIASDPDIPAETKQRIFEKAASIQTASSVADRN